MSKKPYALNELQDFSLAIAEEVHVALQTWESAEVLLLEGAFNDFLQTNLACRPLLSIARGASIAATMALARVWDQTDRGKIKLSRFPSSFRHKPLFNEIAIRANLSEREMHDCITKLERLVDTSGPFGRRITSLKDWRNRKLAHRDPSMKPPGKPDLPPISHTDLKRILDRSISIVDCLVTMLPETFRRRPLLTKARSERAEWRKRSRCLWARVERDWRSPEGGLDQFLRAGMSDA